MPRAERTEVGILRFFEEESLEKAETLFQIVADKMRLRRKEVAPGSGSPTRQKKRSPERQAPAISQGEEVDGVART